MGTVDDIQKGYPLIHKQLSTQDGINWDIDYQIYEEVSSKVTHQVTIYSILRGVVRAQ